jgi:hypothetical protein
MLREYVQWSLLRCHGEENNGAMRQGYPDGDEKFGFGECTGFSYG